MRQPQLVNQQTTSIEITHAHFPYLFNVRNLEIIESRMYLKPKQGKAITPPATSITLGGTSVTVGPWIAGQDIQLTEGGVDLTGSPFGTWTIDLGANMDTNIDDALMLIKYAVN